MLLGRGTFTQNVDEANVIEALKEGRNQELRAVLRTINERVITKRSDLPFFESRYQHLVTLYGSLRELKQEEEELQVNRNRLCSYLRRDLIEFGQEVNDEVDGYIAPSVIKDLLDQLSNLSKRFLDIKLMSDIEPDIAPIPYIEEDSVDGSARTLSLPVGQFTYKIKRKLLELKDQVQDKKR